MKRAHKDVEFHVNGCSGEPRVFRKMADATLFAFSVAVSRGEAFIDVCVFSEAGALAYEGDDGVTAYLDDPDASVHERIEIRVNSLGRIA